MKVVGVRFKKASRIYTFDRGEVECELGEWVVVETERGMALGLVATPPREPPAKPQHPYKKVLRKAEERDILRYEQNCELEGYAQQFCVERIREKNLPMKLVDVEYLFDGSKAIFYFTSENRVDFRELVRDLARQFHTRIEMRQIGVRDESKLVGGVGCCGRELCCATWLTDFAPISVRMAKDQNVSLNPSKISGICGRLMCCLSYEHGMYRELAKDLPKLGKRVETPKGAGKVIRRNVLEGTFSVAAEAGGEFEISADEYQGRVPVAPETEATADKPAGRPARPQQASRPRGRGGRGEPRREQTPEPSGKQEPGPITEQPGASEPSAAPGDTQQPSRKRRRRRRKRSPGSAGPGTGETSNDG